MFNVEQFNLQDHSQCGRIVCGGNDYYARDDCVQMDEEGEWTEIGATVEYRTDHACWNVDGIKQTE